MAEEKDKQKLAQPVLLRPHHVCALLILKVKVTAMVFRRI